MAYPCITITPVPLVGLVTDIQDAIEDKGLESFSSEWVDHSCGWSDGDALNLLRDLALQCVERRPNKRPRTAGDVLMALHRVQETWAAEHAAADVPVVVAVPVVPDGGISVEQYRALEDELKQARLELERERRALEFPPSAPPQEAEVETWAEETATCVISKEECPVSMG